MFLSWMDYAHTLKAAAHRLSRVQFALFPLFLFACLTAPNQISLGQESSPDDDQAAGEEPLRLEGALTDFATDVWPIFVAKCVECHGPEDAKNDFRMDDSEIVVDYLEPGDSEGSSIWTDYLVTDDPDMRMPPPDHGSLTGAELATIRLWIEEGAEWSDDVSLTTEPDETQPVEAAVPESMAARVWIFQGLFHPASVHFPVALLIVSAGMVFLSFLSKKTFEPVAFHCLWIGALGAVASCVMGWSYAQYEGYGAGFSLDLSKSAIDRHRWLGIGTAVIALIMLPIARSARKNSELGMRIMWLVGSLIMVLAVATSGYQGGELTHGEDHYFKEFERLFPEYGQPESAETEAGKAEEDDQSDASEEAAADTESIPETAETNATEGESELKAAARGLFNDSVESNPPSEPTTEEPVTEEPVTEEPVTEEPVTEEPVTEEPVTEEPVTEEPVTEEPVTEEPVTEEPASEESANEEDASENPSAEEEQSSEDASAENSEESDTDTAEDNS